MAAGGTAQWMLDHTQPGALAIGDIGYVGWKTDYPILDLLGLVDPVISKLPGGYTQKLGPGFNDRFFSVAPPYLLLISSSVDCQHPSVPGSAVLYRDPRFRSYQQAGHVSLDQGFAWCIYKKKE
jgi:arabinofuranosyltransferase